MLDLMGHISTRPVKDAFCIERYAFLSVLETNADWVHDLLDMESAEQCLPDNPWALGPFAPSLSPTPVEIWINRKLCTGKKRHLRLIS